MNDKELLDWLQKHATGYGHGWICRLSSNGRGMRLHETSNHYAPFDEPQRVSKDVREAIRLAMEAEEKGKFPP